MKNKYDDAIREAFLKSAFQEAAAQEIAEIEAMDIEVPEPTEQQRREIEHEIRKMERKRARGQSRVWRAVAMIAVVCCLACGVLMLQPTVRASVMDVVISFFEKYFSFDFDKDAVGFECAIGNYQITYVPEGYIILDTEETPVKTTTRFIKGAETLSITLYPSPLSQRNEDTENTTSKPISAGNVNGYLMEYNNNEYKELVFGDETHTFVIIGAFSEKEFIKIAENIQ